MSSEIPSRGGNNPFLWLLGMLAVGGAVFGLSRMPEQTPPKEATQPGKEEKKPEDAAEGGSSDPVGVLREYLRVEGRAAHSPSRIRIELTREAGGSTVTASLEKKQDSQGDVGALDKALRTAPAQYEFLIATVPDPIESKFPHEFDAALESIQQAFAARGFTLRCSRLPWRHGRQKGGVNGAPANQHRECPGVLLFRKNPQQVGCGAKECIALVCLVGESPISGLHKPALTKALEARKQLDDAIRLLQKPPQCPDVVWTARSEEIQLVAPFFTVSQTSLAETLRQWKAGPGKDAPAFRIISGSATELRPEVFDDVVPLPKTTVIPHDLVLEGVLLYLTGDRGTKLHEPKEKIAHQVAILREANTGFGAQANQYGRRQDGKKGGGDDSGPTDSSVFDAFILEDVIDLPFPSSISQLAADQDHNTKPLLPNTNFVEPKIPVRGLTQLDAVPPYDPQTAASTAGQRLRAILTTINGAGVRYVGIIATDARDVVFLTRLLQKECPNARVFTTEPSSVLLHPEDAVFLRGLVVGSTYPLAPGAQDWGRTSLSRSRMIPFPTQGSQGYYNAILAQADRPDLMLGYHPPKLPAGPIDSPALDHPPIWVSVVGNGGRLVPVHCYSNFGELYKPVAVDRELPKHPTIYVAKLTDEVVKAYPQVKPDDLARQVSAPGSPPRFGIPVGLLLGALGAVVSLALVLVSLTVPWAWEKWAAGLPAVAQKSSESESPWLWTWRGILLAGILLFVLPYALPVWEVLRGRCCAAPAGAHGWRHVAVLVAAFAVAVEVVAVLALLVLRAARGILAPPGESRWGPGVLAAVVLLAGGVAFAWSVGQTPIERFFLYVRSTDVSSGLSPLVPMALLGAAAFVIGFCGLRQTDAARRTRLARPYSDSWKDIEEADEMLQRDLKNPLRFLFGLRTLGVVLLIGVPWLLSVFWNSVVVPLPSGEGWLWDVILRTVFWAAVTAVAVTLARFLVFWSWLGKLLKAILNVPMVRAFERLPDEVRRLFGGYLHSTQQLRRAQLSALAWALPPGQRNGLKDRSDEDTPALAAAFGQDGTPPEGASLADFYRQKAAEYLEDGRRDSWSGKSMDEAFGTTAAREKEAGHKGAEGSASHRSDRTAEEEARDAAADQERQKEAASKQAVEDKELFVASYVALYLGPYFAHLRMLAHAMIWPAILLLLAAASYPVQPERPLLNALVGLLAAVAAGTVYVLYKINRDGLVSRITRTEPDRFTPDSGFFSSMLTYVAPVATLVLLQLLGLFRFIVEPILGLFQ
jgi:hypothetical protein